MTSNFVSTIGITLALGLPSFQSFAQPAEKPNVLFITVDDMNDWTSVFNKNNPIKTPNIEKLAERGAFFTHAYCSSPACNLPGPEIERPGSVWLEKYRLGCLARRHQENGRLPHCRLCHSKASAKLRSTVFSEYRHLQTPFTLFCPAGVF